MQACPVCGARPAPIRTEQHPHLETLRCPHLEVRKFDRQDGGSTLLEAWNWRVRDLQTNPVLLKRLQEEWKNILPADQAA